jgi:hypothetical protein
MLRFWILPVLSLIAVLGLACRDGSDNRPAVVATAAPTGSATVVTTTAKPSTTAPQPTAAVTPHFPAATPGPTTFTDAKYDYSYSVPADWYVAGGEGYSVVTSYDSAKATRPCCLGPELLKAETYVYPNPSGLDIQTWIQRNSGLVRVENESTRDIAGEPAVVLTVTLVEVDNSEATQYFFEHSGLIFTITAYTSNQSLLAEFDGLLSTFRIGQ